LNSNKNAVQSKLLGAKNIFIYFGRSFMKGFVRSGDHVSGPAKVRPAVRSAFSRCSVEVETPNFVYTRLHKGLTLPGIVLG